MIFFTSVDLRNLTGEYIQYLCSSDASLIILYKYKGSKIGQKIPTRREPQNITTTIPGNKNITPPPLKTKSYKQ